MERNTINPTLIDGGVGLTGNTFIKIVEEIYLRGESIEALVLKHMTMIIFKEL